MLAQSGGRTESTNGVQREHARPSATKRRAIMKSNTVIRTHWVYLRPQPLRITTIVTALYIKARMSDCFRFVACISRTFDASQNTWLRVAIQEDYQHVSSARLSESGSMPGDYEGHPYFPEGKMEGTCE